jgi:hypothetical protein
MQSAALYPPTILGCTFLVIKDGYLSSTKKARYRFNPESNARDGRVVHCPKIIFVSSESA